MRKIALFNFIIFLLFCFAVVSCSIPNIGENEANSHSIVSDSRTYQLNQITAVNDIIQTIVDGNYATGTFQNLVATKDIYGAYHIAYQKRNVWQMFYLTNASGIWINTQITNSSGEHHPGGIAVDNSGKVHISYVLYGSDDLIYTTNTSGTWQETVVESSTHVGDINRMVLDSNDKVHIVYNNINSGNSSLKYATNQSGSWLTELIDNNGGGLTGYYIEMTMDGSNQLHIAYSGVNMNDIRYTTGSYQSWSSPQIMSFGWLCDIELDNNNKVHTSYSNTGSIGIADNISGSWSTVGYIVTDNKNHGNIGFDSNGNLHMVYQYVNYPDFDLYYATNASGSWVSRKIDEGGQEPLAFINENSTLDIFHIHWANADLKQVITSYSAGSLTTPSFDPLPATYDTLGTITLNSYPGASVRYTLDGTIPSRINGVLYQGPISTAGFFNINLKAIAYKDGFNDSSIVEGIYTVSGIEEILVNQDYNSGTFQNLVATKDSNGAYHIAYQKRNVWQIFYLTNISGSWVNTQITNSSGLHFPGGIAVDSSGKVHISYELYGSHDLIYTTNTSGTWQETVVESSTNVMQTNKIVLDSNDKVHIVYNNETVTSGNDILKDATNQSGSWLTEIIDDNDGDYYTGNTGYHIEMTIDSSNQLHIAYSGVDVNDNRYITGYYQAWSSPQNQPFGLASDIELDSNNNVYICYNNDGSIGVANNISGTWNADSNIDTYYKFNGDIEFDSNGNLHMAYQYVNTPIFDLYYATNVSGTWVTGKIDEGGYESLVFINEDSIIDIFHIHWLNADLEKFSW